MLELNFSQTLGTHCLEINESLPRNPSRKVPKRELPRRLASADAAQTS